MEHQKSEILTWTFCTFTINYVSRLREGGKSSVRCLARKWISFFYSIVLQYLPRPPCLYDNPLKIFNFQENIYTEHVYLQEQLQDDPPPFHEKFGKNTLIFKEIQYLLIYVVHLSVHLISSPSHTDITFHLTTLNCTPCTSACAE